MSAFSSLKTVNERLARGLKVILVVVFTVLFFDVMWGVATRLLSGNQASWSEELARLLMVWLALLGAALVSREDRHLGLDVLVRSWPEEVQRLSQLVVFFIIFVFAAWVMAWGGFELVRQRFDSGQTLPALGISKAWFYLPLPVSGVLMALFAMESFCGTWRGRPAGKEEAVR